LVNSEWSFAKSIKPSIAFSCELLISHLFNVEHKLRAAVIYLGCCFRGDNVYFRDWFSLFSHYWCTRMVSGLKWPPCP